MVRELLELSHLTNLLKELFATLVYYLGETSEHSMMHTDATSAEKRS